MSATQTITALLLWACLAVVFYVYVGYPVVVAGLARLFGRRRAAPTLRDDELPTVTLLIAAYNEEAVLEDPETGGNADSLYWKYETFLKLREGQLGALLGANGGIYALRKSRHVPIPSGTILDDLIIPLLARLKHGGDIVYDPEAVARE